MESIARSALVPYTPKEMFELVSDIDTYPQFLPWCSGAQTLERDGQGMRARIEFSVGGLHRSFTTHNTHIGNEAIEMQLVDGPFSQLEGGWRFEPLGDDGCKISLQLDYDFSSHLVSVVTGPVFSHIANSLVDAFQQRAVDVYGPR